MDGLECECFFYILVNRVHSQSSSCHPIPHNNKAANISDLSASDLNNLLIASSDHFTKWWEKTWNQEVADYFYYSSVSGCVCIVGQPWFCAMWSLVPFSAFSMWLLLFIWTYIFSTFPEDEICSAFLSLLPNNFYYARTEIVLPQSQIHTLYSSPQVKAILYLCVHRCTSECTDDS